MDKPRTLTAFQGELRVAAGSPAAIALHIKRALEAAPENPILAFDDATGAYVDFDLSGSEEDVIARHSPAPKPAEEPEPRRAGRPKLGVVAREVTLLPRHWDWLKEQRGGASAALRRLVEAAIRNPGPEERARRAQAAADKFMSVMLGDQPGYEEAARALYAGDGAAFGATVFGWPKDLRDHAARLAAPAFALDTEPDAKGGDQ